MSGTNGLPNLPGAIAGALQTFGLATGATPITPNGGLAEYGLYNQSTQLLSGANSCIGFGFQVDEQISSYPIEQGGFQSYNKVAMPFGAKLQYTVYQENLPAFLAEVEGYRQDTNTYTVVTPVYSWQNCNVVHWDSRQQDKRAISMWVVDVWLSEVRQPISSQTSATQGVNANSTQTGDPQLQAQQNTGAVQPQTLTQESPTLSNTLASIAADGVAQPAQVVPLYGSAQPFGGLSP